jgi:hypothetical protein
MTGNPLYPQGKNAQYPLDQGWMGLRANSDKMAKGKISISPGIETPFLGRPASNLVTILTELSCSRH